MEMQEPEMPRARQGMDLTLHGWGQSISSWEAQKRESKLWAKGSSGLAWGSSSFQPLGFLGSKLLKDFAEKAQALETFAVWVADFNLLLSGTCRSLFGLEGSKQVPSSKHRAQRGQRSRPKCCRDRVAQDRYSPWAKPLPALQTHLHSQRGGSA